MSESPTRTSSGRPGRHPASIDGQLAEWGARLFYPRLKGRSASGGAPPPGTFPRALLTAVAVRDIVRRVTAPHAKQVMVKVSGGGRGMKAVAAHFRYISRLGQAEKGRSEELEDELGHRIEGAAGLRELAADWRTAGGFIPDESHRREALNIILSMPKGTSPGAVRDAARDFAHEQFQGHKWVLTLHTDTPSPHVHLAVRAQRADRARLQPNRADLQRWRDRFAAHLQGRGVDAIALPGKARPARTSSQPIWYVKADAEGRARRSRSSQRHGATHHAARTEALRAWQNIEQALRQSNPADRQIAQGLSAYLAEHFADLVYRAPVPPQATHSRDR